MTKLTMLIYHRDYNKFLNDLRNHGVVHIHAKKQTLQDEVMKAKMSEVKHINNVVKQLDVFRQQSTDNSQQTLTTELRNEELINFIDKLYARVDSIKQEIASLQKDENIYAQWGTYPEERLRLIENSNWTIRYFSVPVKRYDSTWEEEFNAFPIKESSGLIYFTTITAKGVEIDIDADTFHFPTLTKSEIKSKIEILEEELTTTRQHLIDIAGDAILHLREYKQTIINDANFYKVSEAALHLADDKIMALEGWVPTEIAGITTEWLNDEDIYFESSEPQKGIDNPPIKLKNRRFAKLFEVIGNMYSTPTYWELDLTPFFAPFFVLFFGFCMGDCGYGALLVLASLVLIISKKFKEMQNVLWLVFFLGLGTVVMGIISGTFFGVPLLEIDIPFVNKLKSIMFQSEGLYSAFYISLMIGIFQILFGMCLKIININKMEGFAASLPTIGWVILLLGGIISFLTSGIGTAFYICMIIGAVFIFLLNGPLNKIYSPFVNIGAGLWDTYNMATGVLGDMLSYIRLFALGLSGSILGLVFNDLAIKMSPDIPVLGTIVTIIILLFGHTMNLALSALSAFVHPMRLTFVEFYKNSGFVGGAKEYEPFKNK